MRAKDRTVFLYGFAKKDAASIGDRDLADVRDVAASWMAADPRKIERALAEGLLMEVSDESKSKNKDG